MRSVRPAYEPLARARGCLSILKVHRDRSPPEGNSGVVAGDLLHQPFTGKPAEDGVGNRRSDAAAAVLADDEELTEPMRGTGPHQYTASDCLVHANDEGVTVLLLDPVVVQVPIAVLAGWAELATIELGEVVRGPDPIWWTR